MGSVQFNTVWPTNILVAQLDEFTPQENMELFEIGKAFYERNVGGLDGQFKFRGNTVSLMVEIRSPALMKLMSMIQVHVNMYLEKNYPQVPRDEVQFNYNTFVNYQSFKKRWAVPHQHAGNQVVCTYYPKVMKGGGEKMEFPGALCFHDPRATHANWMIRKEHPMFMVEPRDGTMVVFPAHIQHSTFPFFDETSEKLAIVTNVRFFPKADKNAERMFHAEEVYQYQMGLLDDPQGSPTAT